MNYWTGLQESTVAHCNYRIVFCSRTICRHRFFDHGIASRIPIGFEIFSVHSDSRLSIYYSKLCVGVNEENSF